MILKIYLYIVVLNLILEGILNFRLLKYRQTFNTINELMTTLCNSVVPIIHLKNIVSCSMMIFSSKESVEVAAKILDVIEIEGKKVR